MHLNRLGLFLRRCFGIPVSLPCLLIVTMAIWVCLPSETIFLREKKHSTTPLHFQWTKKTINGPHWDRLLPEKKRADFIRCKAEREDHIMVKLVEGKEEKDKWVNNTLNDGTWIPFYTLTLCFIDRAQKDKSGLPLWFVFCSLLSLLTLKLS